MSALSHLFSFSLDYVEKLTGVHPMFVEKNTRVKVVNVMYNADE